MRRLDLVLQKRDLSGLYSSLSIKIHAFLMSRIDGAAAEALHGQALRPYSLFTVEQSRDIILRLNVLADGAIPLYEAAKSARLFEVSGVEGGIAALDLVESPEISAESLSRDTPGSLRLLLASPATYKHNGVFSNIFALAPLFKSVSEKLLLFEGIEIAEDEIRELCETLRFISYRLNSEIYKVKRGSEVPAFSGELALGLTGSMEQNARLMTLLRYAEYSGVGAKTALGMGGILLDVN